jgi:hypothetical protein
MQRLSQYGGNPLGPIRDYLMDFGIDRAKATYLTYLIVFGLVAGGGVLADKTLGKAIATQKLGNYPKQTITLREGDTVWSVACEQARPFVKSGFSYVDPRTWGNWTIDKYSDPRVWINRIVADNPRLDRECDIGKPLDSRRVPLGKRIQVPYLPRSALPRK